MASHAHDRPLSSKDRTSSDRTTVRYLGRLLGDVIRTEDGTAVFDAIEGVRLASVDAHRTGNPAAAAALSERLGKLDLEETLRFVRGFLLFSLLANLADDGGATDTGRGAC
ncbi:phosphoenolpyruvate carboxylase, partial [Polymorphobacter sp.]|uniref:phosphoenolpyruvate carboxylase n=1 Tax=Polymorphobacter sp. TaxID=1909290 RepID=UPI003F6EB2B8